MVKPVFNAGDLVFARVKGYPAWPAKITEVPAKDKYHVYFYGTYETAILKHNDLFLMSKDNQAKFIDKNAKRKFYMKGIIELINTPDIAPGPKANPLSDPPDINSIKSAKSPAISSKPATPSGITSPPTVRKPFKLSSGTPVKRAISTDNLAFATPLSKIKSEPSKTPATLPVNRTRRASKGSLDEIASPPVFSTPQTSSRSGRVIKQSKRFDDENSTISSTDQQSTARADTQIDDPRKIWVKRRSTGDLIEIRLTMDRPTEWQSEKQKLVWNLATARNACKLKETNIISKY